MFRRSDASCSVREVTACPGHSTQSFLVLQEERKGARSSRNGSMKHFLTKFWHRKLGLKNNVNMQNIYSGLETANKKPQPCMAKCSCFPSELTAAKLIKPEVKGVSGDFMCVLYLLCVCQSSGFTFLEQSPFLTS